MERDYEAEARQYSDSAYPDAVRTPGVKTGRTATLQKFKPAKEVVKKTFRSIEYKPKTKKMG
jgi:hypothetical protein